MNVRSRGRAYDVRDGEPLQYSSYFLAIFTTVGFTLTWRLSTQHRFPGTLNATGAVGGVASHRCPPGLTVAI